MVYVFKKYVNFRITQDMDYIQIFTRYIYEVNIIKFVIQKLRINKIERFNTS